MAVVAVALDLQAVLEVLLVVLALLLDLEVGQQLVVPVEVELAAAARVELAEI